MALASRVRWTSFANASLQKSRRPSEVPVAESTPFDSLIAQGRALVRAIEASGVIDPSTWFERAIAGLLLAAYKPRLRATIGRLLSPVQGCASPGVSAAWAAFPKACGEVR
jgi:hypothetical protein